jgi:hypothetical protein
MHRLFKVIILLCLLLILMVAVGSFVLSNNGLASVGNPLYPVQYRAEQFRLRLTLDRTQKLFYTERLLELRINDLKRPSGDIQEKTIAVSRAVDQLAFNNPIIKTNDSRINSLLEFYRSSDSAIQTCCLTNQDESVLALRRKWKTLGLMIENSTKVPMNWKAIAGIRLPGEDLIEKGFFFSVPTDLITVTHTSYPLVGWHAAIPCSYCHTDTTSVKGILCTDCHSESVPKSHSSLECNLCHSSFGWEGRKIDHKEFSAATCTDCHAEDKPSAHFALKCDACHSVKAWLPVSFDHDQNASADCISCHAVRPGHFDLVCSTCHATSAWFPQNVNHANLSDCVICHESKRPENHYPGVCSTCHSTSAWSPQSVNHDGLTDCLTCHEINRPASHFPGICSTCHSTTAWSPQNVNHATLTDCITCHQGDQPANHFNIQCSSCHATTGWVPANFNHDILTDCQSCHTSPANHLSGQCSSCHAFPSWNQGHPAFNIYHESANGVCTACHTTGKAGYTDCKTCHNKNEGGGGND